MTKPKAAPFYLAQPKTGDEPWILYRTTVDPWEKLCEGSQEECLKRLAAEQEHDGFAEVP